jgi:tryptophan-rich sensory protein
VFLLRIQWKKLIICLAIPLLVGGLSSLLTRNSQKVFEQLQKPFLSPPGWLFPIIWTILFILMGIASYLILTSDQPYYGALTVYGIQLAVNFFWSVIFFNLGWYLFAFFWLILLWLLILKTLERFCLISNTAGYLLLPYLLWVTFAGYLNLAIYLLN